MLKKIEIGYTNRVHVAIESHRDYLNTPIINRDIADFNRTNFKIHPVHNSLGLFYSPKLLM